MEPTASAGNESIGSDLRRSARELDQARLLRLATIRRARQLGVSWPKIGTALGISETAARRLHARNPVVTEGDA